MHTLVLTDENNVAVSFHFNSDCSGDVQIVKTPPGEPQEAIWIPGKALFEFVGQQLQSKAIQNLEEKTGEQFLFSSRT